MEKYDVKILLALMKSLEGDPSFFRWLMENGYPELGAFSNAVNNDKEAMQWLINNGFVWLAVLSNAIDGLDHSRVWIAQHCSEVTLRFALACRKEPSALKWLEERNLEIFVMLAKTIDHVLEIQALKNITPYTMQF